MEFILALLLALFALLIVILVALIIAWFILVFVYLPLTSSSDIDMFIVYAIGQLAGTGLSIIPLTLSSGLSASADVIASVRSNLLTFFLLGLFCGGAFVWLEYHDKIIFTYFQVRQCGIRPLMDALIVPILNIVRIIANLIIPVWNFGVSIMSYVIYGAPVILFKCTEASLSLAQLASYVATFLRTLFDDFSRWLMNEPLVNDFDIHNSIEAFADIFDAAIPALDCFCKGLHFVWIFLKTWLGLPGLSATINFAWMAFINVFQVPFHVLSDPSHTANFTRVTEHSCAAAISAGDFVEQTVLLLAETFSGLISNEAQLPDGIKAALSIRYTHIITHPVCGLFRLVNMTLLLGINWRALAQPNGTGIAYFQFGEIADEFKIAVEAIGAFPNLVSEDGQSLVNGLGFALVNAIAFIPEWVIGNIFYGIFGGPLPASFGLFNQTTPTGAGGINFWQFYFVDYWFKAIPLGVPIVTPNITVTSPIKIGNYTYSSALNSFFEDLFRATQSIGNLLALFMPPLGQLVRHVLNAIIGLLLFVANFVSYSHCTFTGRCSNMPITARDINIDLFFNESLLAAGAAGDLFRQFDNASCRNDTDDVNKTILCLTGEIVETTIDVVIIGVREYFHFIQDLLTLPSQQIKLCLFETQNITKRGCVRIPDLTTAITELDDALCAFGYAVPALIPTIAVLDCPFSPEVNITRTCGAVQTCLGFEFCSILRFIPIILQIVNTLIIKIISGTAFASFEDFLKVSIGLLVNQFATVLEQFGIFLDCSICTAEKAQGPPGTPSCKSPIFDILKPIGNALRDLAQIFTNIFLKFVQMVILLFVGIFSGNPVTAIIDFILAFLQNVLTGVGFALIDFIAQLLDKIGLGFLGTFIQVLYKGFCAVLEVIVNSIIAILKVLSFGYFSHDYVQFCCNDGGCQPHVGTKKRMDAPYIVNGIAMVNMDNWIQLIAEQPIWPLSDACNASVIAYGEIPFTSLNVYQVGELLFCISKLHWTHRDDNQSTVPGWTCDQLMTKYSNRSFDSFDILTQNSLMVCGFNRMAIEGLRYGLKIPWLPQDLMTNPFRAIFFVGGLIHGVILNAQFFSDMTQPPTNLLSKSYQAFWTNMHLDTSLYANLTTLDDVINFRQHLHLRSYFESNDASQYDATVYAVTSVWGIAGALVKGIANMTDAFSDNVTDFGTYISYNYTLDNSAHASVAGFMGLLSQGFGVLTNLTTTWSDPTNYKKRTESYETLSNSTYTIYKQAARQIRLMAAESAQRNIYESTNYYNQSCHTDDEVCRFSGVIQFRETYEASMRGEDALHGATSLVYKFSKWWDNLDLTTYPIINPRYEHCRVKAPELLLFKLENGTLISETHWQRFWRYWALVKKGTLASQRRWDVVNDIYNRTRDKIYTAVLKHVYNESYIALPHHRAMKERFQIETRGVHFASMTESRVCRDSECVKKYKFHTLEYDVNRLVMDNQIDEVKAHRLNTFEILGTTDLTTMALGVADFFTVPCINEVSFPCSAPLECDGNRTTTLCVQCLYLQAFLDRIIAAVDQLISNFATNGHFLKSLTTAFHLFNYSFDPNVRVIVGDSPQLQVGLFPAKGNGFIDSVVQSARYMGDDTPNKLRLNDFIAIAESVFTNVTNEVRDVTKSTLYTRRHTGTINDGVFSVISQLFQPVLQFFYDLYLFIIGAQGEESTVIGYVGETFLICDWLVGDDLSGKNKRFSIGEVVLIYVGVLSGVNILTGALFGMDILAFILTNSFTTMIFMSTFLTFYANYAYLCGTSVPIILPDDLIYFLEYNLFPKCSWFWGFLPKTAYNNDNCYTCNQTSAIIMTHCVHETGFLDFSYNVAFIFDVFFPDLVNSLRTGTGIGRVFVDLGPISARLGHWAGINLDDPFLWARYQGCNWIVTLPSNLLIFLFFFIGVTSLVFPFIGVFSTFFSALLNFLFQLIMLIFLIFNDILTRINAPQPPPITPIDDQSLPLNDGGNTNLPLSGQHSIELKSKKKLRKPATLDMKGVVNFLNFAKDNVMGDRKDK